MIPKELFVAFAMIFGLLAWEARAAPFVIGDVPDAAADTCVSVINGAAEVSSQVVVDATNGVQGLGNRVCKVDVAGVPVGPNSVKIKLRSSVWGQTADSPFSQLDFVRPGVLGQPGSTRLAK